MMMKSKSVSYTHLKNPDIAFLADLMGHESIETTRIYLRRTEAEQRSAVDEAIDCLLYTSYAPAKKAAAFFKNAFSISSLRMHLLASCKRAVLGLSLIHI